MGDRANIVVKSDYGSVCLYSHWGGSELPEVLRSALKRGKDRLGDEQYLARIIFCEMVQGDVLGNTGFGITAVPYDGDDRIILVDVRDQTVSINERATESFSEFISGVSGW